MYKLIDLTDCIVKEFDNLEELDVFCATVWRLQYLQQAIKLNLSLKDMVFEDFKVFNENNKLLKKMYGLNYIKDIYYKIQIILHIY